MNAAAENRELERTELELLHGAIFDREVWELAIDAGLRSEHLSTTRAGRVFRALDSHFADEGREPGSPSVLVARGLAQDDVDALITLAGSASAAQLATAIIDAATDRNRRGKVLQARAALADGDPDRARHLLAEAQRKPDTGIVWRSTRDIFTEQPPTPWVVKELGIGPGRPSMIAAYGSTAKTLSAQQLALSCAAGSLVWDHWNTRPMQVRHLDYEQGFRATARRYQRLAIGHGVKPDLLDGRLQLSVFPSVFLDSPGAADAYSRACEGADLVILDALRGAAPSRDENDSQIRACVDVLTLVSERTGAAFVLIHHAGKPKDGHADGRTVLRGSSAIFDACGSVFLLTAPKVAGDPRDVRQVKPSAEAEGGEIESFRLAVEDVAIGANPTAGVRVMHRPAVDDDHQASADAAYERDAAKVLATLRKNAGATQSVLVAKLGMRKARAIQMLEALEADGRVSTLAGSRGSKTYFPEVA